jgi:hypothetical protein
MSVLSTLYNVSFNVIRKVQGTGVNSKIFSDNTISTNNKGTIRPVTDVAQLFDQTNYGREYNLYCDHGVDIKVGDVVTVGTIKYNVMGKSVFDDLGGGDVESHQRIRLNKANNSGDN